MNSLRFKVTKKKNSLVYYRARNKSDADEIARRLEVLKTRRQIRDWERIPPTEQIDTMLFRKVKPEEVLAL